VPLVILARRRQVMGGLANPPWLTAIVSILAVVIISLNVFLLAQLFVG
jgi:manganese transport protein